MQKENIKKFFYFILSPLNLLKVRRASILMYHSVNNNNVLFTVKPADFKRQLAYLKQNNFNVIALAELLDLSASGQKIPKKTIVLSFDDGYQDNFTEAWPILKRYGFPATIFLPTAYIGKTMNNSQNQPLSIMTEEQIKELAESDLIEFGSHTHTHPRLEKISDDEFRQELLQSKKTIEELTGRTSIFFAYPKGYFHASFPEILKDCGFRCAVTVREGLFSPVDDKYQLKRNFIYSAGGFSQFKGKLGLSVVIYNSLKDILKK